MAIDFNQLKTIKHAIFLPYFWGANFEKNLKPPPRKAWCLKCERNLVMCLYAGCNWEKDGKRTTFPNEIRYGFQLRVSTKRYNVVNYYCANLCKSLARRFSVLNPQPVAFKTEQPKATTTHRQIVCSSQLALTQVLHLFKGRSATGAHLGVIAPSQRNH